MTWTPSARSCSLGIPHRALLDYSLGDMEEDARRGIGMHLGVCGSCALSFAQILIVVGPPHARRHATGEGPSRGRILPFSLLHTRGVIAAAVLLVVATLSAVGALRLMRRPVFVTSSPDPGRTLAEASAKTGLRFEETGISGDSLLLSSVPFLKGPSSAGTVALVRSRPSRRLDLCAFDEHGGCLWVASRDWPAGEWEGTLGAESLTFAPLAMKSLVTKRSGERFEETVAITLHGARRSGLVLVDPISGRRRGTLFHEGGLVADRSAAAPGLGVLPAAEGESRRLLVGGQHDAEGGMRPCLTVLDSSGRGLQHVLLPVLPMELGVGDALRNGVDEVQIDWARDGTGIVQAITSDLLIARIPWRGGRLVLAEAALEIADGAKEAYNRRMRDPRAFETLMLGREGEDAFTRSLLVGIRETLTTFPSAWEDR